MNIKMKATLILLAILGVTGLLVYLLILGGMRNDTQTVLTLPSESEARAYVLDKKLLASASKIEKTRSGGPEFLMVDGFDAEGNPKAVWLAVKDKSIKVFGSALYKEGVTKESIVAKVKEKGIAEDQIRYIYPTAYDYTSNKVIWYVQEQGDKKHMLMYDFHNGDLLWEGYQDPTAWKLTGN
ncbi:hypothetical protein MJA45_03840 [Paenibacillus aurantius]|uniref:DUF5590 domain-containing protein n=1 Tax=Paenibacillus aurantius TaxID=2918900 RepID=A0AA96RGC9_9BACL|nr:hypothetical protein [Paenibacillus aurantius]WNQ12193.1 hypothetical protein MJA45_03840 [Paenibacillus aurantius]